MLLGGMSTEFLHLLPLALGYAEIHFRLQLLPSRLYQRWPEVLADVPHRLEPDKPLPVLLLVKDSHRFPVRLEKAVLTVSDRNSEVGTRELLASPVPLRQPWWEKLLFIPLPDSAAGELFISVSLQVSKGKRVRLVRNDNYPHLSHRPFRIYRAAEPMPRFPGQFAGDLHTHSRYTSDQVEFGASLRAIRAMAWALGLDFVAITDHSYDLDDHHDNFLRNSKKLEKWRAFQAEIEQLNREAGAAGKPLLIPGEEVSARNSGGKTVHFLVLNSEQFFPGSGDGAERFFHSRSEMSVQEILARLPDSALAAAAHPGVLAPPLETALLNRGQWTEKDLSHFRLDGLQAVNGIADASLHRGLQLWISRLLRGQHVFLYAGNDAHGNFGRYRQIKLPFWSMAEHQHHLFGKMRTVLLARKAPRHPDEAIALLRNGKCYVTSGPAIRFTVKNQSGKTAVPGERISGRHLTLLLAAKSSGELGPLREIRFFWGDLQLRRETEIQCSRPKLVYQTEIRLPFSPRAAGYLRVEVRSGGEKQDFFAFSNPVWISP